MMKKTEIRRILITIILVLAIIPISALTILSVINNRQSSNGSYDMNGKMLLNISKTIIDDKINEYFNNLNVLAKEGDFNDFNNLKKSMELLADNDDCLLVIYYGEESDGGYVQSLNDILPEGYEARNRPWYIEAKNKKEEIVIQSPYTDVTTGKTIITISKAVIKDGQLIGVIGMDVELSVLANRLSALKYGKTGQVMIASTDGLVISNTDQTKIGTQEPTEYSVWSNILQNKDGDINFEYESKKYRGYYETSDVTGWKILLKTESSELSENEIKQLKISAIIISIILLVTISVAMYISKKISVTVKTIVEGLLRASKGDFKEEIIIDSPVKEFVLLVDNFNNMRNNLGTLIGQFEKSVIDVHETSNNSIRMSEDISSSIGQVTDTMAEISEGTTKSADGLEVIATDMERLSQSIGSMKEEADNVRHSANEANELGKRGLKVADLVMDKSKHTKDSITEVDNVVLEVAKSIEKIDNINSSIASITEQTNLLALNAAIEAARAGEAGKGFAVVAEEIRKLAEETAVSAKEIDLIIKELDEKSKSVVESVKDTNNVVNEQENAVLESQEIFKDIVSFIDNLSCEVVNIAEGISYINGMKDNVVDRVSDLSALLEETAAGSEEVTASAQEISASTEKFVQDLSGLKEKSDELNDSIKSFEF